MVFQKADLQMKRLLFLIFLLYGNVWQLACQTYGWKKSSFVNAQYLYSIKCINFDTVIEVGDSGYIIRTVNSGANWSVIPKVTNNKLLKVEFVNNQIGYAVGTNGTVLKTTDEGQSWASIGIHSRLNLISLSFINKDTGWVAGGTVDIVGPEANYIGLLMKTVDGGASWAIDSSFKPISSVFFCNKDTGYICSTYSSGSYRSELSRSINGGSTFTVLKKDSTGNYYTDVQFESSKSGYFAYAGLVNSSGIYRTTDFGASWTNVLPTSTTGFVRNLFRPDSCSMFYSYSEVPGCGFVGHDKCTNSNFNSLANSWCDASFINRNKGFCVSGFALCSYSFIYKLDTMSSPPIGITEEKLPNAALYPNPTYGALSLILSHSMAEPGIKVLVYDILGHLQPAVLTYNPFEVKINLDQLAGGIYLIRAMQEDTVILDQKVVKY